MNELPAIPSPPAQRWQDFRLRGVPGIVFVVALCTVFYLWNKNVAPSTFVGEVQGTKANVTCPQPGVLMELKVDQFDRVTKGQVIAKVAIASPETLNASLAAIRADLQVMRARMAQDQQRNNQGYQQLRLDLLSQRVDLATAKASLRFAANEFARAERLYNEKVASEFEYDTARDRRDALAAEVEERGRLVAEFEKILRSTPALEPLGNDPLIDDPISRAIAAQEEQLRRTDESATLRAPIDGLVTAVFRRTGENVIAGEVVIAIGSERPERIIGFIRQPIAFEPQIGDSIEVRTRGGQRQVGRATIEKVGSQMELFTQPLRVRGFDASQERGLPVLISLPENLNVHTGELVDLFLMSSR